MKAEQVAHYRLNIWNLFRGCNGPLVEIDPDCSPPRQCGLSKKVAVAATDFQKSSRRQVLQVEEIGQECMPSPEENRPQSDLQARFSCTPGSCRGIDYRCRMGVVVDVKLAHFRSERHRVEPNQSAARAAASTKRPLPGCMKDRVSEACVHSGARTSTQRATRLSAAHHARLVIGRKHVFRPTVRRNSCRLTGQLDSLSLARFCDCQTLDGAAALSKEARPVDALCWISSSW